MRYVLYVNFIDDDHTEEELERYFLRALEKTGASLNSFTLKGSKYHGRPRVNQPKVEEYLRGKEQTTVDEVIENTGLSDQAVKKVFRALMDEGKIYRLFAPGHYGVRPNKS